MTSYDSLIESIHQSRKLRGRLFYIRSQSLYTQIHNIGLHWIFMQTQKISGDVMHMSGKLKQGSTDRTSQRKKQNAISSYRTKGV